MVGGEVGDEKIGNCGRLVWVLNRGRGQLSKVCDLLFKICFTIEQIKHIQYYQISRGYFYLLLHWLIVPTREN